MSVVNQCKLMLVAFALLVAITAPAAWADRRTEDKLKVAYVYNFIRFVHWPKDPNAHTSQPIRIGVIGPDRFVTIVRTMEQEKAKNRSLVVRHYVGFEDRENGSAETDAEWIKRLESLKTCQLLVIAGDRWMPGTNVTKLLAALEGSSILTIGESDDFLERGGIINFMKQGKKLRFEVNLKSAQHNQIKLEASLLALAVRVLE